MFVKLLLIIFFSNFVFSQEYYSNFKNAFNHSYDTNKNVVVYVYSNNCKYCELFENDLKSINDTKFIFIKVNSSRGNKYNCKGYPCFILLDSVDRSNVKKIEGYLDIQDLVNRL
jgi:thioredoxin-related protein